MTDTSYGLRFSGAQGVVRLMQIAGSGRILLECNGSKWWAKPPSNVVWEAYPSSHGQTYATQTDAEAVAANLRGAP